MSEDIHERTRREQRPSSKQKDRTVSSTCCISFTNATDAGIIDRRASPDQAAMTKPSHAPKPALHQ
ncbi:hypothetical protein XU06_23860 [Rhodococcus erythropolis]|nr:hypothetical protein XU06_23860 [Rhodococcus erythropolis]